MTVYKYYLKTFLKMKLLFVLWMGIFVMITLFAAGLPQNEKVSFTETQYDISLSSSVEKQMAESIKKAFEGSAIFRQIENDELSAKEGVFMDGDNIAFYKDDKTGKLSAYTNKLNIKSFMATARLNSFLNYLDIVSKDGENNLALAKKIADSKIEVKTLKEEVLKEYIDYWYNNVFRIISYPLMSMVMSIIGLSLLYLKDKRVELRMNISSKKILAISTEEFLAQIVGAFIITILSFIIMVLIGKGFKSTYGYYLLNMFAIALSALGFISMVYNINSNKKFINSVSNTFTLILTFISGVFVPNQFLPAIATNIAAFFPMHYYVKANKLALNGFSKDYMVYIVIQLLFATCYFLAGVFIKKLKSGRLKEIKV